MVAVQDIQEHIGTPWYSICRTKTILVRLRSSHIGAFSKSCRIEIFCTCTHCRLVPKKSIVANNEPLFHTTPRTKWWMLLATAQSPSLPNQTLFEAFPWQRERPTTLSALAVCIQPYLLWNVFQTHRRSHKYFHVAHMTDYGPRVNQYFWQARDSVCIWL